MTDHPCGGCNRLSAPHILSTPCVCQCSCHILDGSTRWNKDEGRNVPTGRVYVPNEDDFSGKWVDA